MERSKKFMLLLIILLGIFFFLISMLAFSFVFVMQGNYLPTFIEPFVKYHIQLMVLLGILGVALGVVTFKGFLETKKDRVLTHASSKEIIYRFFDDAEKIIMNELATTGATTQAELSRKKELGKVKTYRTLQRLEQKSLITLQEQGKTHLVQLQQDIKEILQVEKK